jgi:hypothetical protein
VLIHFYPFWYNRFEYTSQKDVDANNTGFYFLWGKKAKFSFALSWQLLRREARNFPGYNWEQCG